MFFIDYFMEDPYPLNFLVFFLLGFLNNRLKNPSRFMGSQFKASKTDGEGFGKLVLVYLSNFLF